LDQEFTGEELRGGDNTYTRIVVAAREARRINAVQMARGISMDGKVTSEAIRRVAHGEVEWEIAPKGEPMDPLAEPVMPVAPAAEEKAEEEKVDD
jgi:DNA-directed RNA polymerase subunit K/omega